MTVLKHFGFNEQETNRNTVNSVVDDRTACLDRIAESVDSQVGTLLSALRGSH